MREVPAPRLPHSPAYVAYLRSPEWQARRTLALERAGYRCQQRHLLFWRCACRQNLQVHHKNYRHLGHERLYELVVLCQYHHKLADMRRRWLALIF